MPTVSDPDLPKFEFTFTDEMDNDFLSKYLSKESIEAFNNLTNVEEEQENNSLERSLFPSTSVFNNLTIFFNTNTFINQLISQNGTAYSQNTVNNGATLLVIGGITLAVPNTSSLLQLFEYEIKTSR
jgi:hypothetical protein